MQRLTGNNVFNALKQLGDTAEAVADSLRKRGIRGVPTNAAVCPLANYLRLEFGCNALVGREYIEVWTGEWIPWKRPANYNALSHTEATAEFVYRFDDNEFRDLMEGA